jgi:hypothetical protein
MPDPKNITWNIVKFIGAVLLSGAP